VIAFAGSLSVHGAVVLAVLLHFLGGSRGGGEEGKRGAGGTTIDISLAGGPSAPAPTLTTPPAPSAPPKTAAREGPAPELRRAPPAKPAPAHEAKAASTGESDATESGQLPGIIATGPTLGVGGDTIAGQRALLPHAVTCSDPVAGRWEALKYSPMQSDWVHFELTVRRGAGGVLSGTILSHTWSGTPFDREPPGCSLGSFDLTVSMNASGRADAAGRITFGSSAYSLVTVRCATLGNSYAPDNFSGTIDPARQEFQSVNNDGFNDINAPYVFRRIGCLDK
jgi:hypothetical protein